ncbi:hypothetical protein GCE86_22865 [Micromonospora terminaliae]|uniref:Uncharacterized protein n=1 Tax=Micromonospora terminaliae TaxID=1914461 RepID=A0ABX6EAH5_9ACTN|nr:hypothetical protein GCE86_22865 [Micromonospora terminaliae]
MRARASGVGCGRGRRASGAGVGRRVRGSGAGVGRRVRGSGAGVGCGRRVRASGVVACGGRGRSLRAAWVVLRLSRLRCQLDRRCRRVRGKGRCVRPMSGAWEPPARVRYVRSTGGSTDTAG